MDFTAILKWLGNLGDGTAVAVLAGGATASVVGVIWGFVRGFRAKIKTAMAAADVPTVPTLQPAPVLPPPVVAPLQTRHDEDLQAARIRSMHLEAELLAVQEHMRKFRRSHDELSLENANYAKAVYQERARLAEAQDQIRLLLAENARLREEAGGAPTRRLRSVPPTGGPKKLADGSEGP